MCTVQQDDLWIERVCMCALAGDWSERERVACGASHTMALHDIVESADSPSCHRTQSTHQQPVVILIIFLLRPPYARCALPLSIFHFYFIFLPLRRHLQYLLAFDFLYILFFSIRFIWNCISCEVRACVRGHVQIKEHSKSCIRMQWQGTERRKNEDDIVEDDEDDGDDEVALAANST